MIWVVASPPSSRHILPGEGRLPYLTRWIRPRVIVLASRCALSRSLNAWARTLDPIVKEHERPDLDREKHAGPRLITVNGAIDYRLAKAFCDTLRGYKRPGDLKE